MIYSIIFFIFVINLQLQLKIKLKLLIKTINDYIIDTFYFMLFK